MNTDGLFPNCDPKPPSPVRSRFSYCCRCVCIIIATVKAEIHYYQLFVLNEQESELLGLLFCRCSRMVSLCLICETGMKSIMVVGWRSISCREIMIWEALSRLTSSTTQMFSHTNQKKDIQTWGNPNPTITIVYPCIKGSVSHILATFTSKEW